MNKAKKLQVFVSSTFIDLQDERQAAVQAILNAGHIPAGMELFIAGDESQWEIIKEWIDESDIYMLIIGGRYGTPEPKSGKSYTQLEFEYAISQNKPHFVIVIDEATTKKKAQKAKNITDFFDNSPQLAEFKKSIMTGKLVHICDNLDKIESSSIKSINKLSQRDNLKGWVRADDTDLGKVSEELARLSKENSELKLELAGYKNGGEKINGINLIDFSELLKKRTFPVLVFSDGLHIDNLLSFFYNLFGNWGNELNDYDYHDNHKILENYKLIFREGGYKTTNEGAKLLVFLEHNLDLVKYEGEILNKSNRPLGKNFDIVFG